MKKNINLIVRVDQNLIRAIEQACSKWGIGKSDLVRRILSLNLLKDYRDQEIRQKIAQDFSLLEGDLRRIRNDVFILDSLSDRSKKEILSKIDVEIKRCEQFLEMNHQDSISLGNIIERKDL